MNCCDQDCHQGDHCPARATRRVKAGGPPPSDLPVLFAEPEPTTGWALGDIIAVVIFAGSMIAIGYALGRLA